MVSLGLVCAFGAFAQGKLEYSLKVYDQFKQPVVGLKVAVEETATGKKITNKTDDKGEAFFEITEGQNWWLHVGSMKKLTTLQVPADGVTRGSQTVPYVPELMVSRDNLPDRTKLKLSVTNQTNQRDLKASGNNALVKLKLRDRKGLAVKNTRVALTCLENNTQFVSATDHTGWAKLQVPVGHLYHVDVEEVDYYQKIDLPKSYAGFETTINVTYQPSNVVEQVVNDTVFQSIPKKGESSASRAFCSIKVRNKKGEMLPNEYVFIRELKGSKVYRGLTDGDGEARFMLPLHHKYMISFQFEPDVDYIDLDASYGQVNKVEYVLTYMPIERLANPGQFIPTPDQVFITEFENFIDRQWPKPKKGKLVDVFFKWGEKVNGKSKEAVLEIGIVTPMDIDPDMERDPINVCFVLDKSGSMAGYDRIDSLKSSLIQFIDQLRDDDIVSLVVFSDEPTLLVSSRKKGDGAFLKESIQMIHPGGGTDIYKGLIKGHEETRKALIASGTNRLVLLSDGYGSNDPAMVIEEAKSYVKGGVDISAIGVGQYYNYALMSQLASLSGGMLHYVGSAENMSETFARELSSLIMPVAKDFQMEIVYNDFVVFKNLYGFEFDVDRPVAILELPHVYAGMKKLGIAKFDLPRPTPEIEKHPVVIRYSYYNPSLKKREYFEENAYLEWSPYTGKLELIKEHEQRKLYAIALMNQTIKVMADAFADEDYQKAKAIIENCQNKIEELYPKAKDEDVAKLVGELNNYSKALQQQIKNAKEEQKKKQKPNGMN